MSKRFSRLNHSPSPEQPPVVVLSAVKLFDVHYKASDVIPQDVVERIPPKNLAALLSPTVGTLTISPSVDIGKVESGIHDQRRATLDEVSNTTEILARIQSEKDALAIEVEALEQVQRASALADYRAGKSSHSSPELDKARARLVSLNDAEVQGVEERARLLALAETLALEAELERARAIAEKHIATCTELQAGVEALVPIFAKYKAEATQFHYLTKETGSQVTSFWRLENLIAERLYSRALSRGLRVENLADLDGRIFAAVLSKAMKEIELAGLEPRALDDNDTEQQLVQNEEGLAVSPPT